jgi:hypothetical protein
VLLLLCSVLCSKCSVRTCVCVYVRAGGTGVHVHAQEIECAFVGFSMQASAFLFVCLFVCLLTESVLYSSVFWELPENRAGTTRT